MRDFHGARELLRGLGAKAFGIAVVTGGHVGQDQPVRGGVTRHPARFARRRVFRQQSAFLLVVREGRLVHQQVCAAGGLCQRRRRTRVTGDREATPAPRGAENGCWCDRPPVRKCHRFATLKLCVGGPRRHTEACSFDHVEPPGARLLVEDVAETGHAVVGFDGADAIPGPEHLVTGHELSHLDGEGERVDAEVDRVPQEAARAGGAVKDQRLLAPLHPQRAKKADDPEVVVGVEVGEERRSQRKSRAEPDHLALRSLAAIEEQQIRVGFHGEPREVAIHRRLGRGSAQEREAEQRQSVLAQAGKHSAIRRQEARLIREMRSPRVRAPMRSTLEILHARLSVAAFASIAYFAPAPAYAHHEALFGPQSSILLSADAFASAQIFSQRLRAPGADVMDHTFLVSAGATPFSQIPLAFVVTAPANYVSGEDAHMHLDDLIVGGRYRFDLTGLQQRFGREGNYVIASAGAEIPTGTGHGEYGRNVSAITGLLGSLEKGAFSGVLFLFDVLNGEDGKGRRPGHELFTGAGLAYTPFDEGGKLLSLQLGASYEQAFRDRREDGPVAESGGRQVIVSPTVVVAPSEHWQLFAVLSAPVWHDWRADTRDAWRVGAGLIYLFAHQHD